MVEVEENKVGTIKARGITKEFQSLDGTTTKVLNNVDVTIKGGEFICLIGPSGCGKSTFLRLIAGLTNPSSGELSLDDKLIVEPGYERGFVFQDPTLFPWLNIYNNIAYGIRVRKEYKKRKNEIEEFIQLVGLKGFEYS